MLYFKKVFYYTRLVLEQGVPCKIAEHMSYIVERMELNRIIDLNNNVW